MSRRPPKDLAASVRQRLLDRSRERGEDFNLVLTRYALERWLFRLSKSPFAKQFVLKGALLFAIWAKQTYRPTRDLDLLASGEWSAGRLERAVKQICRMSVPPDGLEFDAESVRVAEIREVQEYGGLRVQLQVRLDTAQTGLQIDVGFGDAVTPAPAEVTYPTLLATLPAPVLRLSARDGHRREGRGDGPARVSEQPHERLFRRLGPFASVRVRRGNPKPSHPRHIRASPDRSS